ncbi:MAG TPA: LysR family transcriptional regulator [Burkholderiales bacterium]|nr:LysR family transcriptional regulator [Burkholderiales bacterium]
MDLRQLDYFVHVAELGSFSRAAALLSIAQSALSHRVRKLEVELKQPLLYRNGRGVVPTEAGRRLLVHARGILMQVSRTREELEGLRGAPTGHVVVGLPPTFERLFTVPLVRTFRERFRHGSIGMMEGLSAAVVEWVTTGRADIGLVFNPAPSPAIEIRPLLEAPMFLVSMAGKKAARGPVAVRELPGYPLIVPSRPNANRMRIEAQLAQFGLKPVIALECDGTESILDLVREGYGHAVLPLTSVKGYAAGEGFALRPIVRPKLSIQVSLVTSAQRPATPLARQVLALIPEISAKVLRPA